MDKRQRVKTRRAIAILLSFAMAVTCFPLLGSGVFAESQGGQSDMYYAPLGVDGAGSGFVAEGEALTEDEVDVELGGQANAGASGDDEVAVLEDEVAVDEIAKEETPEGDLVTANSEADELSECGIAFDGDGDWQGEMVAMGEEENGEGETDPPAGEVADPPAEETDPPAEESEPQFGMYVNVNTSGTAYVYAYMGIEGVTFADLYVDDTYEADVYGKTALNGFKINMKDYPVGYHTVKLYLYAEDPEGEEGVNILDGVYMFSSFVPTKIYKKPSIKLSNFYTGSKYFTYTNSSNEYAYDSSCYVYLDYKKGSGKWKTGYGPIKKYDTRKKSKLTSAKKYKARIYYKKKTKYTPPKAYDATEDPKTVTKVFTGPKSKSVSFKTAYKKTPVKSIKVKAVKKWCHKIKVYRLSSKLYWRNGYAGWGWYRKILGKKTYKYWYTKVKVTVKMKKKPGVKGIYIGQKHLKGDKKTYSAKFTLKGKKKGKKIRVDVYSYMSKTYGGVSAITKKKVKVK